MSSYNITGASDTAELQTSVDTFFLIVISIIIIFMQCGFAFLEAGTVRSKNTTNILLKNMLDCFIGCIVYWSLGYAFAFGDGNSFIGASYWFGTFPEEQLANWFFHFVFAATACTIVSGGVAERCNFWPYLIYSFVITGFVYPVVSRWAWHSTGWLADGVSVIEGVSYQDFAGSGVVHLTGGVAALIGAIFCGPRIGRFDNGRTNTIAGHSVPLSALGAFILMFGFFAFNGGSQGAVASIDNSHGVARAVVNTIMSGTGGAITNLTIIKIVGMIKSNSNFGLSRWSLLTTINGVLVGMVAICAGCNVVHMWAAFVIGIIASLVYFAVSLTLIALKIDDPLEAVAVHAGGGIWGVLAAPLFDKDKGGFYTPGELAGKQFAVNLIGMLAIIAWSTACCLIMFGILKLTRKLRITAEMEEKGMDILKHGEPAYPFSAWQEAWDDVVLSDNASRKESDNEKPMLLLKSGVVMPLEDRTTGKRNGAFQVTDTE